MKKANAKSLCDMLTFHGAASAAVISITDCRVIRQDRILRLGFVPQTVIIGVLPYYTHACDGPRIVSAYAVGRDYHFLLKQIGEEIVNDGKEKFPEAHFAVFGDVSPIDEVDAAARAGLGVIGKNGLLITEDHSSFVFIFEVLTDILPDEPIVVSEPRHCENCGECIAACPSRLAGGGECLSSVTQKKGVLTSDEQSLMRKYGTAWGCDICQLVCPHTVSAKKSGTLYHGSEWFAENARPIPSEKSISDKDDFSRRAYSWRGTEVMRRNLHILEKTEDEVCDRESISLKREEQVLKERKKTD
ncbi:MAG: DUF1730 domain-containing protein [Clostridia bacterium]|nr:DUF1730 domain-containing protein [Clostridia bacterium]